MSSHLTRRRAVGIVAAAALAIGGYKAAELSADPVGDKDCGPVTPTSPTQTAADESTLPWRLKGGTVNDVSCLSRTAVHGVVAVKSEADVAKALAYARDHNLKVSAFGARHSMGGQAFAPNGVVLDMTGFNAIALNADAMTVTVQSGARWHDIQIAIHPRFAVKAMQSSDVFTVGGSISVNAHGMDHHVGAIERTIKWLRVMLADGSIQRVSRTENVELYRHVVGGYGLFGVILDCELEIAPNTVYESKRQLITLATFPDLWAKDLEHNDEIGLFYGHLSTSPGSFLDELLIYTYHKTDVSPDNLPPLAEIGSVTPRRLIFNLAKQGSLFERLKWYSEKNLEHRFESCTVSEISKATGEACLVSRNEPMHDSVPYLFNDLQYETDILHEYFVPRDKLVPFVQAMRNVFAEHHTLLLNASIRVVHQEDIALNYAPQEAFSVVLYINQRVDDEGITRMKAVTSALIDLADSFGGRFFLPYQKFYDVKQLVRAYPMIATVYAMRKTYDPQGLFTNNFAETYGPLLKA
jgi:FAD/FMN-containing dehydrogenase